MCDDPSRMPAALLGDATGMMIRGKFPSRFATTIAIRIFAGTPGLALVCLLAASSLRSQSLDANLTEPDAKVTLPNVRLGAFVVMAHAAYARLELEADGNLKPAERTVDAITLATRELARCDPRHKQNTAWSYLARHDPNRPQGDYDFQFDLVPPDECAEFTQLDLKRYYGIESPHAVLFRQNRSRQPIYVLAFRGTDIKADLTDLLPDIFGAIGAVPTHHWKSADLVSGLKKSQQLVAGLKTIVEEREHGILLLTGHSLGGGIAEYIAARLGLIAVTFNSEHLSQPFTGDPRGLVITYHVVGKNPFFRFLYSDIVDAARLGGNFEQTRLVRVPISTVFSFMAHGITNFYEWGVEDVGRVSQWTGGTDNLSQPLNARANEFCAPFSLRRSEILGSTPDFVAELPAILRQAIRRNDINRCPAFTALTIGDVPACREDVDGLANTWDLRFRVGYVRDSYPAGGLPIENLRVLDPPTPEPAAADSAVSWDVQASFSHPLGSRSAWLFNLGHRSLSYEEAVSHDFSITRTSFGWMRVLSDQNILTLSADYSHFKSVRGNVGQVLELEAAYCHEFSERKVLWLDASVGSIRRAGIAGGNGTMFDSSAGFRWPLLVSSRPEPTLFAQARTFAGQRTSGEARFADTQWGGGFGLTWRPGNFRAFVEPSARWTRHHLADPAATKLFDRETVLRSEIAYDFNLPSFGRYRFNGWRIALGYSWIKSDTAASTGSYSRRLLGLQLSKSF